MKIERVDLCPTICAEYIPDGDCFSIGAVGGVWMRITGERGDVEMRCVSLQSGLVRSIPFASMVVPLNVTAHINKETA